MNTNRMACTKASRLIVLSGIAALACSAQAGITYNNTITPIVGHGNPSTGWTTATDNGISLSLRGQYNNTTSPLPSDLTPNNGAGTYTFGTGTSTRAVWDFWFDVNSGSTALSTYTYTISITEVGGSTKPFQVSSGSPTDNGVSGNEFQNAEDIGFSFIGFDPSQIGTYDISLTAMDSGNNVVDSASITVLNGKAPVPEPSTYLAGIMLLLPLGFGTFRMLRKTQAA